MSRYLTTATDTTGQITVSETNDRSNAVRGAKRALQRDAGTAVVVFDRERGTSIFTHDPHATETPADVLAETPTPEPAAPIETPAAVVAETPASEQPAPARRERHPRTAVRPFAVELYAIGDEVLDLAAQETADPLTLRVVVTGGSDPHAVGEVIGLLTWRTGVNRWVPALARTVRGETTDTPDPARTGKAVSNRVAAIGALFALHADTAV